MPSIYLPKLRRPVRIVTALALCWFPQWTFAAATIVINNLNAAGVGFNDPTPFAPVGGNPAVTLGQARLNVFQYAANYWGQYLNSSVTITIDAQFVPLTCNASSAVLGSAGALTVHRDFVNTPPYPAPVPGTWYPQALANAIRGADLSASSDIQAQFNSNLGNAGCLTGITWYLGFDGLAPVNTIDLATVLLHEFGHGLGFQTFENVSTGARLSGFPDTFMRFLESHGATPPDFISMTDAQRMAANIGDPNLHWVGANVLTEGADTPLTAGFAAGHVRMFGPNPVQPGSSVSHFHTVLSPNELMEPIYTTPTRHLGLTLALLQDIGWQVTLPELTIVRLAGTSFRISWTGPGTLQQRANLNPTTTWADVAGNPSSPFTTTATGTEKYFRLRF